jgi:hypothetical protein
LTQTGNLFFLVLALGSLERINFGTRLQGGRTDMCGHVAVADLPFERRIGTRCTIPAGLNFQFAATAVALFNGLMANPAVIGTALCGHERTLSAFSNGCTNHWNHPLESFNVMNTDNKMDRRAPPARLNKTIIIKPVTIEAIYSVVNTIFQQVFIGLYMMKGFIEVTRSNTG